MEKLYTPGPWNFEEGWKLSKVYSSDYTGFELQVGENANSMQVKYDVQWRANATLASVAPELLEALEDARRLLDNSVDISIHPYYGIVLHIDQIIAKAYGG